MEQKVNWADQTIRAVITILCAAVLGLAAWGNAMSKTVTVLEADVPALKARIATVSEQEARSRTELAVLKSQLQSMKEDVRAIRDDQQEVLRWVRPAPEPRER